MKGSFFVFAFLLFVNCSFGQKSKVVLEKYFRLFYKSNIKVFEGYSFVSDSLGQNEDIKVLYSRISFTKSKTSQFDIKLDSLLTYLGKPLKSISFSDFLTLPKSDSNIVITEEEFDSFNEIHRLDIKRRNGELTYGHFKKKLDSVKQSANYISYERKSILMQKRLLIFYRPIIHANKVLIACRAYVNGRWSDTGDFIYKVFTITK